MSYYIDIIDTTSPLVQIVPKSASASGIVLEWSGGDTKDGMAIIGSNLMFDMLTPNDDDASFIEFFTGDEHQFKVLIKKSTDNSIVWQGYILPDLYEEPYKNVNFFVKFGATDGLGRLKGKYLPADYYTREKSLIDIYCQILRLTGLDLDLYFAPAIENFVEKSWHKIYIDTESFLDNNKRKDAYSIFETLLSDTLCVCYQCDNRWYIEGINMRHVRKMTYKKYDIVGNYLGLIQYDRVLKAITPLVTPMITIISPYNEIIVNHKKIEPSLPKVASNETNDGWALVTGVIGIIDPSEWISNGNYFALCPAPGYFVTIYNQYYFDNNNYSNNWPQDDTKFISLRKQLFFEAGNKVKFVLEFSVIHRDPALSGPGTPATWYNVFKYEIIANGVKLFSNYATAPDVVEDREDLKFDDSGNCKIEIEHVFVAEAIVDIKLYRPKGSIGDNGVLGVQVKNAKIEILDFVEEQTETDLINGDFTIDKKIDLMYAEDKTGFSNGFRLAKLKESSAVFNEITIPILHQFDFNGKHFSQVQLKGANLIKENIYQVYYLLNLVQVNDVIYNWQGGEQMVVETAVPYTTGSFTVKKYAIETPLANRSHWTQWTDAFYKIENVSYIKTVCNIFRRMFNVAHEKLDVTALNALKFNDLVQFHYVFMKDFVVLNCSWNLDENKTTLTLARSNYKDSAGTNPSDANIPPIVVAGNDLYIDEGVDGVSILASAYDPDGFIASQQWTKLVGDAGDVITPDNQLGIFVSGLTGNFYTYQIQVTDNDGATAVDTINIIRTKSYTVTLDLVEELLNTYYGDQRVIGRKYKLNVSPPLLPGYALTFTGVFNLYAMAGYVAGRISYSKANFSLEKNGLIRDHAELVSTKNNEKLYKDYPETFSYISTDDIYITLGVNYKQVKNRIENSANFHLQTVVIATGVGSILGLPINVEVPI